MTICLPLAVMSLPPRSRSPQLTHRWPRPSSRGTRFLRRRTATLLVLHLQSCCIATNNSPGFFLPFYSSSSVSS